MIFPEDLARRLTDAGLAPAHVEDLARAALEEDLDGGLDVTTEATVPAGQRAAGDFVARAPGVVAGVPVAEAVLFCAADGDVDLAPHATDGDRVRPGDVLLSVTGPTRALLSGERTALNLLCRLSGVATATRAWVDTLDGTGAAVRDTRKTTPLLRSLEKYAVRCGGGQNHRMSLSDSALVKDNHVVAAGGVAAAFRLVGQRFPGVPVEVEVDDVDAAAEAAEAGARLVLLDNFSPDQVREAVARVAGRARLEVSGGLTLANAREYGEAGVDFLAVGALTHSSPALDVGFDLVEVR